MESSASAELLRSVHTSNLPGLFERLQISLVISTYQAGKVILVRADEAALNTHFCSFSKPMGIAADPARPTIGGANTVWCYRNVPAVAAKIEPPGKYDACYLPRHLHVTGDIDIHEMAYDQRGELWLVNTRFGCLCTVDREHSFHPRWRPPFVSAYAPEDRCHLNGLAMRQGQPKYVTALGETDHAGGWRANKRDGGLLMDIETNAIVLRGLSIPHSPRWYRDQLWLLESGQGSLALADLEHGTWRTVAQLPGFTRGMDFYGPVAFIGLSQVRESATFSGIPLVERLRERICGVWVVHIETGETLGFLRFEAGVQEIFAVQVLAGVRFPNLLEWNDERLAHSYVLPDEALAQVRLPSAEEMERTAAFHFQRAMALDHEKKLEEAIAAYRYCVALDPIFPNARYNLGVALGDAGEYEDGFAIMQSAAEAEPERAGAWNSLGYLACRLGRPHEGIAYYERAIELRPEYA
ncbi:MAG: TIGR03032 family protein [Methylococcales bacterium]